MNTLKGTIADIKTHEDVSLVKVNWDDKHTFTAVVIDTTDTANYLKHGKEVKLLFKETEVCISKDDSPNISIQNKIPCVIQAIKPGIILSQVILKCNETTIKSIITTNACTQLKLSEGDKIVALIKSNEISLSPND